MNCCAYICIGNGIIMLLLAVEYLSLHRSKCELNYLEITMRVDARSFVNEMQTKMCVYHFLPPPFDMFLMPKESEMWRRQPSCAHDILLKREIRQKNWVHKNIVGIFIASSFAHAKPSLKVNLDTWAVLWKMLSTLNHCVGIEAARINHLKAGVFFPFARSERDLFKNGNFVGICWYIYFHVQHFPSVSMCLQCYFQLPTTSDEKSRKGGEQNDRMIFPLPLWLA